MRSVHRLDNMPIAYLLLVHNQPKHVARLINQLDTEQCHFFIHVDAKVDEAAFREGIDQRRNVTFLKNRIRVNWGGFSQAQAMCRMLAEAARFDSSFTRFSLLSGADFPIKSNREIARAFESDREFMRVDRVLWPEESNSHDKNVRSYWFMDARWTRVKNMSGRFKRSPYKSMKLYHGAGWWALSRDCANYVLNFLSSNPQYYSYFKYALCADEILFISILKNSPFSSKITHDFEKAASREEYFRSNDHGSHYIDWNARDTTLPKVLGMEDVDSLLKSNCLFARKFDEQRSADLVKFLEERLRADGPKQGGAT